MDVRELDVRSGSLKQLTFETNSLHSPSVSADDRIAYEPFWHDTFHTQDNQGARLSPDGQSVTQLLDSNRRQRDLAAPPGWATRDADYRQRRLSDQPVSLRSPELPVISRVVSRGSAGRARCQ